MLRPAQRSREVTPSSGKGVPSDVTIHSSREGIHGGKKRHKKRLPGATTMTNHNDGNNGEAGGSGVRHISTATRSDKCQVSCPRTTSRGSSRKPALTTHTPSGISSRTTT
jgi:hypothetical protein